MEGFLVLLGLSVVVLAIAILVHICGIHKYTAKISNKKIEVRPAKTTSKQPRQK